MTMRARHAAATIGRQSPRGSTAAVASTAAKERRQYCRLNSILPIELQLFDGQARLWLSETLQGYTQDVSAGGLCIRVFQLSPEHLRWLDDCDLRMQLTIHLLPFRHPVRATARLAWMEAIHESGGRGYHVGVTFEAMESVDRLRLLRYARRLYWLPKVVMVSVVMLLTTVGSLFWHARVSANARNVLTNQVHDLTAREARLRQRLTAVDDERKLLEAQWQDAALRQPAAALTELKQQDAVLRQELRTVTSAKAVAEAELLNHLYGWLRVHQYPTTGLMISYEGDSSLEDWAFTYDQALMVQCFLLFGNTEAARHALAFFATKATRIDGGFVNAYDAVSGNIREYAVHAGPNLWIGLAALQYTQATGDRQFVPLATSIVAWIEQLQRQDPEGGIRGGPKETWFSTEHNLDAYALFTMLAHVTGEARYRDDAQRVMAWLKRNAHGHLAGQINRGRGDATIATDTFAWAIAALGPSTLLEIGIDPDKLLSFAEEHCAVRAIVTRPNHSRITVDGFDFSKPKHLARGGVISTEWTGQMIVAMKMMDEYHRRLGHLDQANAYHAKALHYQEELAKLIISSPCPMGHAGWALPYASQGNVDTGHGWRTAQGATTGSTSGTVYHIFARLGFNPLQLDHVSHRVIAETPHASADHRTP